MRVFKSIFLLFFSVLFLCASQKPQLLLYTGVTMYEPMKKIAKIIEKKENCSIEIIQGASKDIYFSATYTKTGDLFLSGVKFFKIKDIFLNHATIGYNKPAIFVKRGNPKKIKGLKDFLRDDVRVSICDSKMGAIGMATKELLGSVENGLYEKIFLKSVELGIDSRSLNSFLLSDEVDAVVNWIAASKWSNDIEVIELTNPPKVELILGVLKFSKHRNIAKSFLDFASSEEGLKIMKEYGF